MTPRSLICSESATQVCGAGGCTWVCPKLRAIAVVQSKYAVYDGKIDELVVMGTAKECAAALGIEVNTLRKAMCKTKHGAYKKYSFCEVEDNADDCS